MPDKVYIVTSGYYSDYKIVAVFSEKTAADSFCEFRNKNMQKTFEITEYNVEEYPLDAAIEKFIYYVYVNESGVESIESESRGRYQQFFNYDDDIIDVLESGLIRAGSTRGYDVALKIARDKLAEIKAKESGIV